MLTILRHQQQQQQQLLLLQLFYGLSGFSLGQPGLKETFTHLHLSWS